MEYSTDISCFSYACSSCGDELVNKLKYTNKLLLPQSVLYSLQEDGEEFVSLIAKTQRINRIGTFRYQIRVDIFIRF